MNKRRNFLKSLISIPLALPVLAETKKTYNTIGEWFKDNKTAKLKSIVEESKPMSYYTTDINPPRLRIESSGSGGIGYNFKNPITKLEVSKGFKLEKYLMQLENRNSWLQTSFPRKPQIFRLEETNKSVLPTIDLIDCLPPCLHTFRFTKECKVTINGSLLTIYDGLTDIEFLII